MVVWVGQNICLPFSGLNYFAAMTTYGRSSTGLDHQSSLFYENTRNHESSMTGDGKKAREFHDWVV